MTNTPAPEYTVRFIDRDGNLVTRQFATPLEAGSYCLALKELGFDYAVDKHVGAAFTNWAEGVING
jgi:hypothetical protein